MNNIGKGPAGTKNFTLRTGSSVKLNNNHQVKTCLLLFIYANDYHFLVFPSGLVETSAKTNHLK